MELMKRWVFITMHLCTSALLVENSLGLGSVGWDGIPLLKNWCRKKIICFFLNIDSTIDISYTYICIYIYDLRMLCNRQFCHLQFHGIFPRMIAF